MKKQFPVIILALALCLGLAVPALAAEAARPPMPEVTLYLPDGSTAAEKTDTYQILHITGGKTEDGKDAFVYAGEPSGETLAVMPLPLGASVAVGRIARLANGVTCSVTLTACSDPDGDGVYQERIFFWQANTAYSTTDYDLIPLTAKGPFAVPGLGACGYVTDVNINSTVAAFAGFDGFRFEGGYDAPEYALTTTSDALYQLFGPDTLLRFTAQWSGDEPAELACFLLTGEGALEPQPAPAFTDVPDWCAAAVEWAAKTGVTNGATPTTFDPGTDCTHAQILTMLWRAAGEEEIDRELSILVAEPYRKAILWADDMGMINLPTFDPNASCNRGDAVRYISQALLVSELDGANGFADVPADAPYAYAVAWAVKNGVTNGYANEDGTSSFRPDKVCSRGEIATLLHRAYVPAARLTAES